MTVLPDVLAEIRMTPSSTKMPPFEILMGRPFPTPWVKGCTAVSSLGEMEVILEDRFRGKSGPQCRLWAQNGLDTEL